jgi:hypothetical protein
MNKLDKIHKVVTFTAALVTLIKFILLILF